jgi:hypothetical protein
LTISDAIVVAKFLNKGSTALIALHFFKSQVQRAVHLCAAQHCFSNKTNKITGQGN